MSIENIDNSTCISCGTCKEGCPMDVIRWDTKANKPKIDYVEDCMICGLCKEYCPVDAITIGASKCTRPTTGWG